MLSHRERERARAQARLQAETPAPNDDDSLVRVQVEAKDIVREAKGRFSKSSKELAEIAINDIGRSYYRYLLRRRGRPS